MFYLLLILFWFIREIKAILFWLYFWQLKEYHIGRAIDHFRTQKGKRLIFNTRNLLIVSLFAISFSFDYFLFFSLMIAAIYFLESIKFLYNLFLRKIKRPVFTIKALFLFSLLFLIMGAGFLKVFSSKFFISWFLAFDILTPLIVSFVILLLQPLTMLLRNRIIKKAKKKREGFEDLLVIGITGSYGKTSTKEFLYEILSKKFNVLKTEKHQNSEIGIANCILSKLKKDHEVFIVEMGAYNKGGIKMLCDMVKPSMGILTGINEQHLATFGSIENIIEAKYELIEFLPKEGVAILNGSNNIIWDLRSRIKNKKLKKVIFCSENNQEASVFAESIQEKKNNLSFNVLSNGKSQSFTLQLLGRQNVENALLAIACSQELGMQLEEISRICKDINEISGMMKLSKGVNGIDLIESTYSANPSGVIAHLNYLKQWGGKKIIIMPCLIELAQASSEKHIMIGESIGEICDFAIIVTKDKIREIKEGALRKGMKESHLLFIESPDKIYQKVKDLAREGDVVLLEGKLPIKLTKLLKNEI